MDLVGSGHRIYLKFSVHLNYNYKRKYENSKIFCVRIWGYRDGEDVNVDILGSTAVSIFRVEIACNTFLRNDGSATWCYVSVDQHRQRTSAFYSVYDVMNALSYTSTPLIRLYDIVLLADVLVFVSENFTELFFCWSIYLSTIWQLPILLFYRKGSGSRMILINKWLIND